jgi:hypothetical protein
MIEWITALSSALLAILTLLYIFQNNKIIEEMRQARKTQFLPHIKANLARVAPTYFPLELMNVGAGAAVDVDVRIIFVGREEGTDRVIQWAHPMFAPGMRERFLIEPLDFEEFAKRYARIVVRGTCRNVFGEECPIHDEIDLDIIGRSWFSGNIILPPKSIEDRLGEIVDRLRDIERELKKSTRQQERS